MEVTRLPDTANLCPPLPEVNRLRCVPTVVTMRSVGCVLDAFLFGEPTGRQTPQRGPTTAGPHPAGPLPRGLVNPSAPSDHPQAARGQGSGLSPRGAPSAGAGYREVESKSGICFFETGPCVFHPTSLR